jgi:hypothetical protein
LDLGRLEMGWKTGLGEPGRLHSIVNMQQWKLPPPQDLVLTATRVPDCVQVETPFTIELRVLNNTSEPRHLTLVLDLDLNGPILDCGGSAHKALGTLAPGAQHCVKAELMAMQQGLCHLAASQISVVEVNSKMGAKDKYQLAHPLHVLVHPPHAQQQSIQSLH